MDNFKIIYRILHYLEQSMDIAEPDTEPVMPAALGITEERWKSIIQMLMDDGYIQGVEMRRYVVGTDRIVRFEPRITLKGLEYLNENSLMKKAFEFFKGIKDSVPFV